MKEKKFLRLNAFIPVNDINGYLIRISEGIAWTTIIKLGTGLTGQANIIKYLFFINAVIDKLLFIYIHRRLE